MPDEPLDLGPIKTRLENITQGPWELVPVIYDILGSTFEGFEIGHEIHESSAFSKDEDDARFIQHSRTDIPALIAEVERLRAEQSEIIAAIAPNLRAFYLEKGQVDV